MPAAELAAYLESHKSAANIALLECFSQRVTLVEIGPQATLRRALQVLRDSDAGALHVGRKLGKHSTQVQGVLTRGMIERCYQPPVSA